MTDFELEFNKNNNRSLKIHKTRINRNLKIFRTRIESKFHWSNQDSNGEFNYRNPKVLFIRNEIEFHWSNQDPDENSITETLSYEFNLLRIAKGKQNKEKEKKCKNQKKI